MKPGTKLGHYEILAPLGAGGMGEVYRARDSNLDRDVAIKVLPDDFATDADRLARFEREAKALAALDHPNIVTIHSFEEIDGIRFLAMQLVEGDTLADLVPAQGFSLARFMELSIPVVDAVGAAHEKGITHRDLKPTNIMVGSDGRVRVLDFGLARLSRASTEDEDASQAATTLVTVAGKVLGTTAYMSPEQAAGGLLDHRSDIFSLGILFYEMLTGRRPFGGDTRAEVITSIIRDTPPSLTESHPMLPGRVAEIIERALAKDPDDRPSTRELKAEFEALRGDGVAWQGDTGRAEPHANAKVASRSRMGRLVATGVLGVVVLSVSYWAWQARSGSASIDVESLSAVSAARSAYLRGLEFKGAIQPSSCVEQMERAVEVDPDFVVAHYHLSISASWDGQQDLAIEHARRANVLLDLAPEQFRAVIQSNFFFVNEMYSEAVPQAEAALQADPDNVDLLYFLNEFAVHQARDPDMQRGAAYLRRLIELEPEYPVANFEFPWVLGLTGNVAAGRAEVARLEAAAPRAHGRIPGHARRFGRPHVRRALCPRRRCFQHPLAARLVGDRRTMGGGPEDPPQPRSGARNAVFAVPAVRRALLCVPGTVRSGDRPL